MLSESRRLVIVGGVAGGASAAARARRCSEGAEIILLERDGDVSFANCGMPYYIGGEIADRSKLVVASAQLLRTRFRIDVRERSEAVSVDRAARTVRVRRLVDGSEYDLSWDRLILSPGAAAIIPPLPGINSQGVYSLRSLMDMDRIRAAVDAAPAGARRAIVAGAGFIGLEMAEQLVRQGFAVQIVELQSQVLPAFDADLAVAIQEELVRNGVQVWLGRGLQEVCEQGGRVQGVTLSDGTRLPAELVILGIGVRPNVGLAVACGLELGPAGGIRVNEFLQTSDPLIYAAGDAVEYPWGPSGGTARVALAGPANRAGRLAGEHAVSGRCAAMRPVQGTSIVRVFGQTAAMTGLSVRAARRAGLACRSATVIAGQHAGYYPGASNLTLKLVYEPVTGRLLGAQATGADGADKRIDVLATVLAFGGSVRDVAGLDLCYAPPFGSARDPLHQAAFVACNELDGLGAMLDVESDLAGWQVVDVRTPAEVSRAPLTAGTQVIPIPLDELRDRLGELDSQKPTVVSCGVGVRAHAAQRILLQHGFREVVNLTGGATLRRRVVPPESLGITGDVR
ncbi:NADH oxidase [Planctomycetia bacterium]|nr:NADH oxidase [Planctomycetia bacterium]